MAEGDNKQIMTIIVIIIMGLLLLPYFGLWNSGSPRVEEDQEQDSPAIHRKANPQLANDPAPRSREKSLQEIEALLAKSRGN